MNKKEGLLYLGLSNFGYSYLSVCFAEEVDIADCVTFDSKFSATKCIREKAIGASIQRAKAGDIGLIVIVSAEPDSPSA